MSINKQYQAVTQPGDAPHVGTLGRDAQGAPTEELVQCIAPRAFKLRLDNHLMVSFREGINPVPASLVDHFYCVANGLKRYTPNSPVAEKDPEGSREPVLKPNGPTVEQFVEAGFKATAYPPEGFASRSTPEEVNAAIEAQAVADLASAKKDDPVSGEGEKKDDPAASKKGGDAASKKGGAK